MRTKNEFKLYRRSRAFHVFFPASCIPVNYWDVEKEDTEKMYFIEKERWWTVSLCESAVNADGWFVGPVWVKCCFYQGRSSRRSDTFISKWNTRRLGRFKDVASLCWAEQEL